jgi:SAM-dependent methyltransferase
MDQFSDITAYKYKKYLIECKKFFQNTAAEMTKVNHYNHNLEPNFWKFMMRDLLSNPKFFENTLGFEYGSGAGRNLVNMLVAAPFKRVDGIDVSKDCASNSSNFVKEKIGEGRSVVLEGDGYTCRPFQSNQYSFLISHQVFIHIPNYEIRKCIYLEIFRILIDGGIFIAHYKTMGNSVSHLETYNNFPKNFTKKFFYENADLDE